MKARATFYAVLFVLFCLAVSIASAQTVTTGPVSTAHAFEWEAPNVASVAYAQTLVPRFSVDMGAVLTAPGTVCRASTPPVANQATCKVQLTPQLVALLNIAGSHATTLRLFDPTLMLEGVDNLPFVWRVPPGAPTGLRIVQQAQP